MNVLMMGAMMALMWVLFHRQGHHNPSPSPEPLDPAVVQATQNPQPHPATQNPERPKEGVPSQPKPEPKTEPEVPET